MKLTELEPRWFSFGGERGIAGLSFLCPCCRKERIGLMVNHPDPGVIHIKYDNTISLFPGHQQAIKEQVWEITGDAPTVDGVIHGGFENVSLSPAIDASASGHWHGSITNGEVI